MSTPEGNLAPKNYIISGISKNLLTPCRRVGLSRSKKTPSNSNTTPQYAIPKEDIYGTPVNISKSSIIVKPDVNLDDTPKRSVLESDNSEVHSKSIRNKQKKYVKDKNMPKTAMNVKQEISTDVPVEEPTESKRKSLDDETVTSHHMVTQTSENNKIVDAKGGSVTNSPPISPVIHKITAQVHQPSVKRSIKFEKIHHSSQNSVESASSKENMLPDLIKNVADPQFHILEDITGEVEKSSIKSKKRKLRLNSDDFETIEDDKLIKSKNCKPLVGTTLAKFNTEDYLNEYSQNPKEFQKNLEIGNPCSTNDDDDFLIDFMPNKNLKMKKAKNERNKEKNDSKSYVAILCPIDVTKKDVMDVSKEGSLARTLTVNLERTSNNSIKKESMKSDYNKINHNPMKTFTFNDSDDEMFTSSPESDKKQRENLLQLISKIEREVKQQEETVERLKRAQVYKKIHSPVKMKEYSDMWVKGCQRALSDLLLKMQEHGPINIETLIRNLKIPDEIIRKLKLF